MNEWTNECSMSSLSSSKISPSPGPRRVQSPTPREQRAPLPAGISMCNGLGRNFESVPRWDRTGRAGGYQGQERSRPVEEVYFVCYLEVLSGKVAGALITHSHTQCPSWQEEEMPCIFQPLVPRPSLNASPKNTAWEKRYANSSLLSLSPSSPHLLRFIFEWGHCMKVTWY